MRILLKLIIAMLLLTGCTNNQKRQAAHQMCDKLLNDIAEGKAASEFPASFSPQQVVMLQNVLNNNCDFKNRQGKYVNDFYEVKGGGTDRASFIYEYYLKCDSLRIIATYNLGNPIELSSFKCEKLQVHNPMIIDKTKELKY